jgi:hypothetical protein
MLENQSEVAQLKQRLVAEYEAGKRGLEGLALGAARHDFITKRVENMSRCQMQLVKLVGNEQASKILTEVGL